MTKPELDTVHAILTKRAGSVYGKGFWAEWVRACFYCERHGLVRVMQPGTGTEGPCTFIVSALGSRIFNEIGGRDIGVYPAVQKRRLRLLLPPDSVL